MADKIGNNMSDLFLLIFIAIWFIKTATLNNKDVVINAPAQG